MGHYCDGFNVSRFYFITPVQTGNLLRWYIQGALQGKKQSEKQTGGLWKQPREMFAGVARESAFLPVAADLR